MGEVIRQLRPTRLRQAILGHFRAQERLHGRQCGVLKAIADYLTGVLVLHLQAYAFTDGSRETIALRGLPW